MMSAVGCEVCWPDDAITADKWRPTERADVQSPVHESHFFVQLARCNVCKQRYVNIFAEKIDWVAGNDPQHSVRFPVSDEQAVELLGLNEDTIEPVLARMGSAVRRIESWWPATGSRGSGWVEGPFRVPPHD
jgi:hypothetical protein